MKKYLSLMLLMFIMFACGNPPVEPLKTTLVETYPTDPTNPTAPAKGVQCKAHSSSFDIESVFANDTVMPIGDCCIDLTTCPVGVAQESPAWFNFTKFQQLTNAYLPTETYLYINKETGIWYLTDETDVENINYKGCGVYGNMQSTGDYYNNTQGTGTLDMTYNTNLDSYAFQCIYEYAYSQDEHHKALPLDQTEVLINCELNGDESNIGDTVISYYYRSFGF